MHVQPRYSDTGREHVRLSCRWAGTAEEPGRHHLGFRRKEGVGPLVVPGRVLEGAVRTVRNTVVRMVDPDAEAVEADLRAGRIKCPRCGSGLWPWGYARARLVARSRAAGRNSTSSLHLPDVREYTWCSEDACAVAEDRPAPPGGHGDHDRGASGGKAPGLPLSEWHVRSVLAQFVSYYNHDRPHRSLGLETPVPSPRQPDGEVVSRPVLNGLHHVYERAA